jgi:carboxypeptidase family protein
MPSSTKRRTKLCLFSNQLRTFILNQLQAVASHFKISHCTLPYKISSCRDRRLLIFVIIIMVGSARGISAQNAAATLSGVITDQQGSVVPGVNVAVINLEQGFQRQVTSDESGSFVVALLPPGKYIIKAIHDGFAPAEVRDVTLNVNDRVRLSIQLKIASIGQNIDVLQTPSLIDEATSVGTVVDRQFVENLPSNGRSFQTLITRTPGVVLTKTDIANQGQFSVNGQRADANYFTVDGVSANVGVTIQGGFGQAESGSLPALTSLGGTNNLVSIDALEEFKIQTSTYAPEFGRTPGAQIQILTRSGTKEFHGSFFDYFRNDVLDANDWFANSRGLPRPAERQNDFGAVLGGPVVLPRFGEGRPSLATNEQNHTFFFFSYEGLRLRQPQTAITNVPSLSARASALPQMQPFLNAFPIPNGTTLANGFSEFAASYSDPSTLNATSIRIDHIFGSKVILFGRYNYAPSESVQRGVSRSLNTLTISRFKTITMTLGATFLFSPKISDEFRANYSRNNSELLNRMDNFGGGVPPASSALFPSFAPANSRIVFVILGGTGAGYAVGAGGDNIQRQINILDTLSVISGRHEIKLGIDYRRLTPIFNPPTYGLNPAFASVSAASAGQSLINGIAYFPSSSAPIFVDLSLFAQDTWRPKSGLAITYGLRWESNNPPTEMNGNNPFGITGLDQPSTLALVPRGTTLYKRRYNNFAPRIGVSYLLSQKKDREIVIRGGFGIFYNLASGEVANLFANTFPFRIVKILNNVSFPLNPIQAAIPSLSLNPPLDTISVVDPLLKLPFTYQWNLAGEKSFGPSQTVSISYIGAVGRRLIRRELLRNPNPTFTAVFATRNSAASDYHALQFQYQRRLSRGLQGLAAYTWSHSIDTASSDITSSTPGTLVDPSQDRASSDFDVRHSVNAALTYDIPKVFKTGIGEKLLRNFSVDSSFTARTATPVNVVTGTNLFGITNVFRPDLIQGIPLYIFNSSLPGGKRINSAAFRIPPTTRQGTLGRNALRGFPLWQLDFALRRQFYFNDRVYLQFRAEFFNIFNHPNFGDPGASAATNALNNAQFGISTFMLGRSLGNGGLLGGFNPLYQVGGPRSAQLALKLNF